MSKDPLGQFPDYLPPYYRLFCKVRKLRRQTLVRLYENKARKTGAIDIVPDEPADFIAPAQSPQINPQGVINKSGFWLKEDLSSLGIKEMAERIESLKKLLTSKNLRYTSSAGSFLERTYTPESEQRKLWENSWIIHHSQLKPGFKVLDIGGASTAFVFYLASIGCSVRVIDNDWGCCGIIYNTNYVAGKMKWDIKAIDRDIALLLPFCDESFDRVFSICTVEHLSSSVRRSMMREAARVLKPAGILGLTIDYDSQRKVLLSDKGLRFGYRQKLFDEIINPSGLSLYGNQELVDNGPKESFLGALFLKKD